MNEQKYRECFASDRIKGTFLYSLCTSNIDRFIQKAELIEAIDGCRGTVYRKKHSYYALPNPVQPFQILPMRQKTIASYCLTCHNIGNGISDIYRFTGR